MTRLLCRRSRSNGTFPSWGRDAARRSTTVAAGAAGRLSPCYGVADYRRGGDRRSRSSVRSLPGAATPPTLAAATSPAMLCCRSAMPSGAGRFCPQLDRDDRRRGLSQRLPRGRDVALQATVADLPRKPIIPWCTSSMSGSTHSLPPIARQRRQKVKSSGVRSEAQDRPSSFLQRHAARSS